MHKIRIIKTLWLKMVLLLAVLSAFGSDSAQAFTYGGLDYEVLDAEALTAIVARNPDASGHITIPATVPYNGKTYTVTTIINSAFYKCSNITEVDLPSTLKYIEAGAFADCDGIESIVIPGSVISVGGQAFEQCHSLSSVTIENGVQSIGERAFKSTNLTEITIPASVKSIGGWNFTSDLTTIIFEDGPDEIQLYGCLYSLNFFYMTGDHDQVENIYLGRTVSDITDSRTSSEERLRAKNVTIGPMVKSIPKGLFKVTGEQECLVIPEGVTSIGEYAFGKSQFKSIILPESLTEIGYRAFESCSNLQAVTIPSKVNLLHARTFAGCNSLKEITINSSKEPITFEGGSFDGAPFWPYYTESVKIFRQIVFANDYANPFSHNTDLKSVWIDDYMTSTLKGMFDGCTGLERVYIGNSVQTIESQTFSGCTGIETMHLGRNVKKIKNEAYDYCSNIRDFYSLAATPPAVYPFCLDEIDKNTCTLHYPSGAPYATADQWCEFTHTDSEFPISFSQPYLKAKAGTTFKLTPKISMQAPEKRNAAAEIAWQSSNPAIATVDQNGNVTVIKEDLVTVAAHLSDGEMATCTINGTEGPWVDAGVESIVTETAGDIVGVYNLQGILIKTTSRDKACEDLPAGLYIIGGKKILIN